ncbi:IS630 family transposase [bacterium]|nr:IS630 family transposase [bacterium]
MARIGQKIQLSDTDYQELLTRSRSQCLDYRFVLRAKIILLCVENKTYDEIGSTLNIGRAAIAKWKKRFLSKGLDGLNDLPRSGKPKTYTEADRVRVVQKACSKPQGGYSNWSQRRIAKEVGMSQSKVHQILKENELKPHKVDYWCGKSTDPEFEQKMLTIVGLYINPPDNALVLCVDEKTQMQALDRTQPVLPLQSGNPKRLTSTYKRHGTISLIASLAVHQGEIVAQPIAGNNAETFLKFLKKLDRLYTNKKLHIIVDNLSVHKSQIIKDWLSKKRKITLYFTPTYSSWLNQIEIWFNILTKDVLKGAVWHSKEQMVKQIIEYIDTYNKTRAKPFNWTYDGKKKSINSSIKKSRH